VTAVHEKKSSKSIYLEGYKKVAMIINFSFIQNVLTNLTAYIQPAQKRPPGYKILTR